MEFVLDESISHEQAMLLSAAAPATKNLQTINNPLELGQQRASKHGPVVATKAMLSNLQASQVLVQTCPAHYERPRYFYAVDPTIAVTQCSSCNHFFEQEEMDLATLEYGYCPFCGVPPSLPASSNLTSTLGSSLGQQAPGNLLLLPPLPSARKDLSQVPSKAQSLKPKKREAMDINMPKEHQGLFCMTRQDHVSVR